MENQSKSPAMARENVGDSAEVQILQAAKRVFLVKGLTGARMQEIADEAGMNKALLHYYFRSKEKLFEKVFYDVLSEFMPLLGQALNVNKSIEQKMVTFAELYYRFLSENPFIPQFIIGELSRDPEGLRPLVEEILTKVIQPNFYMLVKQIAEESEKGLIRPVDPVNLIVNIVSMSIFPFLARPILSRLLFGGESEQYDHFLEERKKLIPEFIMHALKP